MTHVPGQPDPDFAHQVELAGFPAGVAVTEQPVRGGRLLRAEADGRGLDLLLTDEAAEMYGEGPSVALALKRLRDGAEAGLGIPGEDGQFPRTVFVGD
ncbi:hypothetical protein [Deinococcus sp. Leaf326]|uniref:hypothetical protein n=1 Tax=Deinococcus sp. Leaf326 TaxID=1736338 RepID=UPI0006FDD519|nr:hypothetical protein [Deinococcus sp. Leaf326]KQR27935.1 hypothetical protein ASF71_04955 [Deinococcus sp. Leaf326]